jgi:hypothetical protein
VNNVTVYVRFLLTIFKDEGRTSSGWLQKVPKHVRVLVKQCNLVNEKWCIKPWFDENRQMMEVICGVSCWQCVADVFVVVVGCV